MKLKVGGIYKFGDGTYIVTSKGEPTLLQYKTVDVVNIIYISGVSKGDCGRMCEGTIGEVYSDLIDFIKPHHKISRFYS